MTDTNTDGQRRVGRWVVASAIAGTVLIGMGAFWLSFTALADLARRAGTPAELAWVWPLIVDGVIVIATISVVALSGHGRRATRYPWTLLAGTAIVSVSANITHAVVAADEDVPAVLASLVASVPPVVLLAITHLTVELSRYQHPARSSPLRAVDAVSPSVIRPVTSSTMSVAQATGPSRHIDKPWAERSGNRHTEGQTTSVDPTTNRNGGIRKAIALRAEGLSNRKIAERLGVHPSTVGRWLTSPEPILDKPHLRDTFETTDETEERPEYQ